MNAVPIRDSDAEGRQKLIDEGTSLDLRQAVRELLNVADSMLDRGKRPPVAHGGAYLDRWRWERLRKSYEANLKGFSVLESDLKTLPPTWIPALLRTLIQTATKKKVFKDGGLEVFVQGALGK